MADLFEIAIDSPVYGPRASDTLFNSSRRKLSLFLLIGGFCLFIRLVPLFFGADGTLPTRDQHVSYVLLASGLVNGCGFAPRFGKRCGPPELERTPGYPLFLAGVQNRTVTRIVQDVLGGLICIAVAIFAWRQWGFFAGLIAELLVGFDIASILNSNTILSDTLFAALVTSALLLLSLPAGILNLQRAVAVLCAAILIGLAMLVRPIGQILIVVPPVALLFFRASPTRKYLLIAASLALSSMSIFLWSYRNYLKSGNWVFSSVSAVNLYAYRAAGAVAYEENRPFEQVRSDFLRSLSHMSNFTISNNDAEVRGSQRKRSEPTWSTCGMTFDANPVEMRNRGVKILLAHPWAASIITVKGLLRNCFWVQRQTLGAFLFGPQFDPGRQLRGADFSRKILTVLSFPGLLVLMLIQLLVLALTWIGVGLAWRGPREAVADRQSPIAVPLLFAFLLLVAAAGPEASDRFRVPAMPALALLAAYGWSSSLRRIRSRESQEGDVTSRLLSDHANI